MSCFRRGRDAIARARYGPRASAAAMSVDSCHRVLPPVSSNHNASTLNTANASLRVSRCCYSSSFVPMSLARPENC
jgi:hypothetical protein